MMTSDPHIVILAGGISSRMKNPSTSISMLESDVAKEVSERPKSMITVGPHKRPFLDYVLHVTEQSGYRDVVIVIGQSDTFIRERYGRDNIRSLFPNLSIRFAVQSVPTGRVKPLGTADALLEALLVAGDWKGHSVTVCNSDNLYSRKALVALLLDTHRNTMIDYDRSALQFDSVRISMFSVIRKTSDGFLEDIIEKPAPDQIAAAADSAGRIGVSMNIFRFTYDDILPYLYQVPLHPMRGEKELPVAVRMMIADHPGSMYTIPLSEHVIDLTSQSDIPGVKEYLASEFPEL